MKCPVCGRYVTETNKAYSCDCVTVPKVLLKKVLTPEIVREIITDRRTKILDGFVSTRTGKKFSAALVIRDKRVAFEFEGVKPGRQENGTEKTGNDLVKIRIHSENSGTAHISIRGAMYFECQISYGHVSSRMAESLAGITSANLVKHKFKNVAGIKLDISLNNLDFSRYILKERVPRDVETRSALEHLFNILAEFGGWTARYELKKRARLTGSPNSNNFPRGIFPGLSADVTEENGRVKVHLPGGPDIQAQFKASLQKAVPDGENTYTLPVTKYKALMAWVKTVKGEGYGASGH